MRLLHTLGLFTGMVLLGLSISGCPSVQIKDEEVCGSLASKGATCFHTLTEESRTMTLQEFAAWWNDLSDPKIATRASAFADAKAALETLCSINNVCTYEQKQVIAKLSNKFDSIVSVAKKTKGAAK